MQTILYTRSTHVLCFEFADGVIVPVHNIIYYMYVMLAICMLMDVDGCGFIYAMFVHVNSWCESYLHCNLSQQLCSFGCMCSCYEMVKQE